MNFPDLISFLSSLFQVVAYVGGGVVLIGVIIFGIRYGFGKARDGSVEQNTNLLENLQTQINSQKELISDLQLQVKKLSDANIALTASNAAYLSLFQGTNPTSLQTFMGDVRAFMSEFHTYVASQSHQPIINVQK